MEKVHYFNTLIHPKGLGFFLPIMILCVVIIFLILLMVGILYSMKNTALALTEKEIVIKSLFYGRKIPLEKVFLNEIRSVNLQNDRDYNISFKTNGISLPGFKSGWMRLKNGGKALTFITDKNSVVLIPTEEYALLFSMDNIDDFIRAIKKNR